VKKVIARKQWDELTTIQKSNFWGKNEPNLDILPDIGQQIEFLGEDWFYNAYCIEKSIKLFDGELCDALWSACKHKLNQH